MIGKVFIVVQYGGLNLGFLNYFFLKMASKVRTKRSRSSTDALSSSPHPVKKLVKPTITTEDESKLTKSKPTANTSTNSVASSSEVKKPAEKDVEKFRKACRTIQSLFEQMKVLKGQDIEKTASFIISHLKYIRSTFRDHTASLQSCLVGCSFSRPCLKLLLVSAKQIGPNQCLHGYFRYNEEEHFLDQNSCTST